MAGLMAGRRGLIMGVANDHSIAWGIAKALRAQGAELAFSYQGEALGRRVRPLAESLGSSLVLPCDVDTIASIDEIFASLRSTWNDIDFVVHCIAYSAKAELKGRYADTTRENFSKTMLVSAFSFTEIAKRAAAMMRPGGSLLTLTFGGATRVMPNYNVMGVAKAALEASVRYLAADYGPDRYPRQCDLGRPDPHAGGRRHHRFARHVRLSARPCADAPIGDDRGRRRRRSVPS